MSDKAGTSPAVLSLPNGGGAVKGIGETFTPDPFTGTGSLAVPIWVPSGRNGFQPQLALTYSTGNGNGPFGLGWSLELPAVTRKTAKGVPRYLDQSPDPGEHDTFILSGAEDLVPVSAGRYRPRSEGLFAKIERDVRPGADVWRVRSVDGEQHLYGGPDAVVVAPGRSPFAWKIALTTDRFGNRIEYGYLRDGAQLYAESIRYADYRQDGRMDFAASVALDYDARDDAFSDHRAGFEVRTRLRCSRIRLQTHAGLVRTYELTYLDELVRRGEVPASSLPLNGVSLLARIECVGHDGPHPQPLPPLELGYTSFAPEGRRFEPLSADADALPPRSLADGTFELVSLFANGLPDIVNLDGVAQLWRNLGGGRFDSPRAMPEVPAGVSLADPGVQIVDLNGDGRSDLLVLDHGGYFPIGLGGRWSAPGFVRYDQAPRRDFFADRDVRFLDLDGDGVIDALRTAPDQLELLFNHPTRGWDRVETRPRRPGEDFPDLPFSDPRVKLADMTGDGLQDIVVVDRGGVSYWPYLGHGEWGARVFMGPDGLFDEVLAQSGLPFDPRRVLLGDVDGDGLADLVYLEPGRITMWINQAGSKWNGRPVTLEATQPLTDVDGVRLVDLLGNGTCGILWTNDRIAGGVPNYQFLDLSGGAKPYLLATTDNRLGATTKLSYAPSTRFYLDDLDDPIHRWKAPLPFPVQVIDRIETIDRWSRTKLVSELRYHHGTWDGGERELRGFGMVEQLDTLAREDYDRAGLHGAEVGFERVDAAHFSPPTLTRTWFHLGAIGDDFGEVGEANYGTAYWEGDPPALTHPPADVAFLHDLPIPVLRNALRTLRGSVLRTELYALDSSDLERRPFEVTEAVHAVAPLPLGAPWPARPEPWQERVFFPHLVARRSTHWERGDDPQTRFAFVDGHDAFGQPTRTTDIAVPREAGQPYLATHTAISCAQRDDDTLYRVNAIATTSTFEILNDGSMSVAELHRAVNDGSQARRLIARSIYHYDGEPFVGLPAGDLGTRGALMRTEVLSSTPEILLQAYGPDVPPYLAGRPWTDAYPPSFRASLPERAGHAFHDGGLYVATERYAYDFQRRPDGRGLVEVKKDALGNDTHVVHDARFQLLPVLITDALGLATTIDHDERLLQIARVTDPNGSVTEYRYTPLGLLASVRAAGASGEGDAPDLPGTTFTYDLTPFVPGGQPVSVTTTRRADGAATLTTVEYSDGHGRVLQSRAQAEDVVFGDPRRGDSGLTPAAGETGADAVGRATGGVRVVVNGARRYDNKGRVIEQYEPFFASGWAYEPPAAEGHKVAIEHDALGRPVRTIHADGSQTLVIRGVPPDLARPEDFRPTPWEVYSYDANDNAGRTHGDDAATYRAHWNTPGSMMADALGRTVESVERNGPDPGDWETTSTRRDIQGNVLEVRDPLGRRALRNVWDLLGRPLRTESIDAGTRLAIYDASGKVIEGRDDKGSLVLHGHDAGGRPVRLWARDAAAERATLRVRQVYGDELAVNGLSPAQARAANLLGRLHRQHDEAGVVSHEAYDFKGNLLEKVRRVIQDAAISIENGSAGVDWEAGPLDTVAAGLLDPTEYRVSSTYDSLGRAKTITYPKDASGARKILRPRFNQAGALESATLDDVTYVERIAYDAMGQRTLVALGNGTMTRYLHDARTRRLARLCTEAFERMGTPSAPVYRRRGVPIQDLEYRHDLVGNPTTIVDATRDSGVPRSPAGAHRLSRSFSYDARYRLRTASGREADLAAAHDLWDPGPRGQDPALTRLYTESYTYDAAGNLTSLAHSAESGSFTRTYTHVPGSNRLAKMSVGGVSFDYAHDANGNVVGETTSRRFEWDHSDRLRGFRTAPDGSGASVAARYLYDASGQRVKKVIRSGGKIETSISIGGLFERVTVEGRATDTLEVIDGERRVALVRVGPPLPGDGTPEIKYQLGDHLGSVQTVLDVGGGVVGREEHTAFGETSFGSQTRKRYRFTGRERDWEHGLAYHGARYFAPWLARWMSADPQGSVDGLNLYAYVAGNPLGFVDPSGTQAAPAGPDTRPFEKRMRSARLGAYGDVTFPREPRPEDIWQWGHEHGLFTDAEAERVLGQASAEEKARLDKMVRRAQFEAGERWRAQVDSFHNQLLLMPIQGALLGGGSFGAWVARGYLALQTAQTARGLYVACHTGNLDTCATEAFPLVLSLAATVIGRLAAGGGGGGGRGGRRGGGSTSFLHGTTVAEGEAMMGNLKPVSTETNVHPTGSFFTFEASQPNALVAATHMAHRNASPLRVSPIVLEMSVPNNVLKNLTAKGLVKTGPVPGLPLFPNETVFYPDALKVLNDKASFRLRTARY